MLSRIRMLGIGVVMVSLLATSNAQTQNYVAKFNATGNTTNSSIFDNGKIGIGTTSPIGALDVAGHVTIGVANLDPNLGGNSFLTPLVNTGKVLIGWNRSGGNGETDFVSNRGGGSSGGFNFYDYTNSGSLNQLMTLNSNGGDINGALWLGPRNLDPNGDGNSFISPLANSAKVLIGWNRSGSGGETDFITNRAGGSNGGFNFYEYSNSGVLNQLLAVLGSGNVGVGTGNPGARLEVAGTIKISSGIGAGMVFGDNTTQTTAWTGVLCGGDYAESVGVSGERTRYQPGDVLVIDPANSENFVRSSIPYASTVAGIYSTKPGVTGRRSTNPGNVSSEVPMAMVGIVPTKVSAENGPIRVGDLLVTSTTPGHAMRGTDRAQMLGAVVGKALGSLDQGTGVVNVLVTLH